MTETTEAGRVVVATFVWSPQGIPLVLDSTKQKPHFWKMPGGHGESAEDRDVIDAAVRELYQETGIKISRAEVQPIGAESRRGHTITFFMAHVNLDDHELKERGDNGEIVRVFTHQEFGALLAGLHPDGIFFEPHRTMLKNRETQRAISRFLVPDTNPLVLKA